MPERQHTITALRRALRRCDKYGTMTAEDAAELGELLGLDRPAHPQGVNVPDSTGYRTEHIARAQGKQPTVFGTPDWD